MTNEKRAELPSQLQWIAKQVQASKQRFDDEVSLCEYVSRRLGCELTLAQASKVLDYLDAKE